VRLWSLHPQYLDGKGLVALWREALLAQAVLAGLTRGYTRHPQLDRFRETPDSRATIASYLRAVAEEGERREYRFDRSRIMASGAVESVPLSESQLMFEWRHLLAKLTVRDPRRHEQNRRVKVPKPHPLFEVVSGPIASWERNASDQKRRSQ
jgi:hypothetical protein